MLAPSIAPHPVTGAVVAWSRTVPSRRFPQVAGTVMAVHVPAEGPPAAAVALSAPGVSAVFPFAVRVGVQVRVAWTQFPAAARSTADAEPVLGDVSTPGVAEPIPGLSGYVVVHAAGGADGTLAVVADAGSAASRAVVAVRRPDGVWEPPMSIPAGRAAPRVAVGADGTVAVVRDPVAVHVRSPQGVWSPGRALRRTGGARPDRDLVVGADGAVAVSWTEPRAGTHALYVALRAPAGAFGRPRRVALGSSTAVLTTGAGGPTLAWRQPGGFRLSRASTAGGWSAPVVVPGTEHLCRFAVPDDLLESGTDSTVVWTSLGRVWTVGRRQDGTWGPVTAASGRLRSRVWLGGAVDDTGTAVLSWTRGGRVARGGGFTEVLDATVAGPPVRERAASPAVPAQVVRAVSAATVPGGRLRVRFRLSRPSRVTVSVHGAASGERTFVPPRYRGRAGLNAVTVPAPNHVAGSGHRVEVLADGQRDCPVEAPVRAG